MRDFYKDPNGKFEVFKNCQKYVLKIGDDSYSINGGCLEEFLERKDIGQKIQEQEIDEVFLVHVLEKLVQ